MARVRSIRDVHFDQSSETEITCGECSDCGNQLLSQWRHGFPVVCPYCGARLENGTDDRDWIHALAYGPEAKRRNQLRLNPLVFREYDIRGIVDQDLTAASARVLGRGIGTYLRRRSGGNRIAVGRDNRPSSQGLRDALEEGLLSSGCDVIDIGLSTSPLLYMTVLEWELDGGVNVTGSHNPVEYNGFKVVGSSAYPIGGADMGDLAQIAMGSEFETGRGGIRSLDPKTRYYEKVLDTVRLQRPLRVAVDTGNGVAGLLAPHLLRELGCEVVEVHCELDGSFPSHLPNPEHEANVLDLEQAVIAERADIGLAFDGDGDRLGLVDENGRYLSADYILILLARDFLSRHPGERVVVDVKSSDNVAYDIRRHGGVPVPWKTGHSVIKKKMRDEGIMLGGEFSGHMFVFEDYYPIDDALMAGARILQMLSQSALPLSEHVNDLPVLYATPLVEVPIDDCVKRETVMRLSEVLSREHEVNDLDGAKVFFPDGWALVRASNTSPNLTLRFEADTPEGLDRIRATVYDVLRQLPSVRLES